MVWGIIFRNGRRVHRFLLCQNYMMFPLVLYPPCFRQFIAIFAVAEGWLLLDIGWLVLFFLLVAQLHVSACDIINGHCHKYSYDVMKLTAYGPIICWFTRLFTSNTPWYFLDFACCCKETRGRTCVEKNVTSSHVVTRWLRCDAITVVN